MERFFTENSIYLLDDENHCYKRLARPEDERVQSMRNPLDSWRLSDDEWLPLREWRTENVHGDGLRLRIFTPDAVEGIVTSPLMSEGEVLGTEFRGIV